jgi:hypothetical protein
MDSETITIIVSFLSAATVALNMWTSKNKINKIENDRQKTKYIRDEQSENTLSRVSVLEEQYKNIEKLDIKVDKLTDVVTDIRLKNAEK